jgi:glycosyltransferase involved in cell wall biosynthesis
MTPRPLVQQKTAAQPRVCVIAPQSLKVATVEFVIAPLCEFLAERGMDVTLLLLHHDFEAEKQRSFTITERLRVHYVGQMMVQKSGDYKKYYSIFRLVGTFVRAVQKILKHVLATPHDVLMIVKPHPHMLLVTLVTKIIRRKPLILFSDDLEAESNTLPHPTLKVAFKICDILSAKLVNTIIVPTTFLLNHYRRCTSRRKVALIPYGINTRRYETRVDDINDMRTRLAIPLHAKVILYAGLIHKSSGHRVDLLVKAFCHMKDNDNVWLVIAGSGDPEYIRQCSEAGGNHDRVIFTGRFSTEEIRGYYTMADLIADPVDDSLTNQAKGSTRILLAKVFGKPVITCDVGDRKEWVGLGGVLVEANSIEAMAGGIESIMRNDEGAAQMASAAVASLDSYRWETVAGQYANLIEELSV